MHKKLIEYFTIWIKPKVSENELRNESLEYLCMKKEDERSYYTSKLPIFFAWLWIVVSLYIAAQSNFYSRQTKNIIIFLIFIGLTVAFIMRFRKLFKDLEENNRITNYNLEMYDKIILIKLKEKERKEEKYKKEISSYLKSISENIK